MEELKGLLMASLRFTRGMKDLKELRFMASVK